MASNKNEFFKEQSYSKGMEGKDTASYNKLIVKSTTKSFNSKEDEDYYLNLGGWKARRSGKEIKDNKNHFSEKYEKGVLTLEIFRIRTSWREWIKTIGQVVSNKTNKIVIIYNSKGYELEVIENNSYVKVIVNIGTNSRKDIYFMALLKNVFRKAAYCINCGVCEANCPNGYIKFVDNDVVIDNKCSSCLQCQKIPKGCLVANSLRLQKGERKNMKSIDRYFNMGIEYDWIKKYFKEKDVFFTEDSKENTLGSKKIIILKRFLGDCEITKKQKFSDFGKVIDSLGISEGYVWALLLVNLSYTPQFNWYIKNLIVNSTYTTDAIKALIGDDMTKNSKKNIVSAFKNIFISIEPFSEELGLGICNYDIKNGKRFLNSITRTSWKTPEPRVILYALFKFAEACNHYYQFTLSRLLNSEIESDGMSPAEIFGLDRETMETLLNGLAVNYPDFISVAFTHDLDNITLKKDKTSEDVLSLFEVK